MSQRRRARRTSTLPIIVAVLGALVLIGVGAAFGHGPATAPSATASDTADANGQDDLSGPAPTFVPGGDAATNQAFFNWVNRQTVVAKNHQPTGPDFINALVAAGFDRSKMQLTPDITAAGETAPSVQFSVQLGNECLIGQWGTDSDGYQAQRTSVVDGIGCLIGKTRPINW